MPEEPSQPGAESPSSSSQPTPPSTPIAVPTRQQVFVRRFASTVTLWGVAAVAFIFPHTLVFAGLGILMVVVAMMEYFRMAFASELAAGNRRPYRLTAVPVIVVTLLYVIGRFGWPGFILPLQSELEGLALAAVIILLFTVRLSGDVELRRTYREIAIGVFGFAYLALLFGFVIRILMMPELVDGERHVGHLYLVYLLAITKFTDMGAYVVGSMIGKHKMIPRISPGKTWEGIIGGVGFAALAAFGLKALMPDALAEVSWVAAGLLALALSVLAVIGDLAASIIKRSLAVKDSGHVMPGIGGVLDLIDSILFTAPAFYLYLLIITG